MILVKIYCSRLNITNMKGFKLSIGMFVIMVLVVSCQVDRIFTYEHSSDITEDETWNSGTHVITGEINISNATLTIMPGVVVEFELGGGLVVGYGGGAALIANGTTEKPIIFTTSSNSPVAGDWEYIWFDAGTLSGSILNNCIIEYGGGYAYSGMVHCNNTDTPRITNCTLQHSNNHAISLSNSNPTISNNIYSDIAGSDVYTY